MRERDVILAEIDKRISNRQHIYETWNTDSARAAALELKDLRSWLVSLPQHEPSELVKEARANLRGLGRDTAFAESLVSRLADALDASTIYIERLEHGDERAWRKERIDLINERNDLWARLKSAREALESIAADHGQFARERAQKALEEMG